MGQALERNSESLKCVNTTICLLSQVLYEYYGQKVIILIDDYDAPINSAYEEGYYPEVKDFFRALYSNALKENDFLEMAVLTGIKRITLENLLPDLNNLRVCTAINRSFCKCFGFTTAETAELLNYYGLELNEEVKNVYDGYYFAGLEIYHPWSVFIYCNKGRIEPWWQNNGYNGRLHGSYVRDVKNDIISCYAKIIMRPVLDRAKMELQQIKEYLLFYDSGLKNFWDEVCVQVRYQETIYWDVCLEIIENIFSREIDKLQSHELSTLWLQTYNGWEWQDTEYNMYEVESTFIGCRTEDAYMKSDIIDYLTNKLLDMAVNYSNKRIEDFLERGLE